VPYFEEAVAGGVYPPDGGKPQDVLDDLAFLAAAGQVEGDPAAADPNDYWDFGPLEAAKAAN
jgi:NitT/TauT family transport system substrate-binding protein